jgi:hypothetical protein
MLIVGLAGHGCAASPSEPARAASAPASAGALAAEPEPPGAAGAIIPLCAYQDGLAGVHPASPSVTLQVGSDPGVPDAPVLLVDYAAPSGDPAARDVRCDPQTRDWTTGSAIAFRVKPARPLKLSLSFLDRNRVVYTHWAELEGGVWQPVRIAFADMRPNPYFQPPGAHVGAPLDVSDVKLVAFAPHDDAAGQLALSPIVVVQ